MIVLVAQGCRRRGIGKSKCHVGFMLVPPSHSSGGSLWTWVCHDFLWSEFRPCA